MLLYKFNFYSHLKIYLSEKSISHSSVSLTNNIFSLKKDVALVVVFFFFFGFWLVLFVWVFWGLLNK